MNRQDIEELIYGKPEQQRRFTQDFPILPDVWIAFAEQPNRRIELLLTPYSPTPAATLNRALRERLRQEQLGLDRYRAMHSQRDATPPTRPRILFNESVVFANFNLEELIRVAMPLTGWWKNSVAQSTIAWEKEDIQSLINAGQQTAPRNTLVRSDPRMLWKLVAIVGTIECDRYHRPYSIKAAGERSLDQPQLNAFVELLDGLTAPGEKCGLLYSISRNRPASTSVWRSRMAVKADAAARVFDVDTAGIRWAVLDVGIDARHKGFARRKRGNGAAANEAVSRERDENGKEQFSSRVVRTYDFLRIKDLLDPDTPIVSEGSYAETLAKAERETLANDLQYVLESGRGLDWDLIEPFIRIPHVDGLYDDYQKLVDAGHGTHVAGIIAANWPEADEETCLKTPLYGICPNLELFDFRVLGKDKFGDDADEFTIIAALQFIRHLNAHRDLMTIQGANLSMAVTHDVANYACGRTPICEECERVVASGVVVVTAAGNRGFNKLASPESGAMGDYRVISITDPGNAENVITVGSTHRFMPHTYGVSYFSSRGPTGDGRVKPDLVAPGERIDSCAPGNSFETMDGTSMAAPHVSGAAALIIARHRELVGQPKKVKDILCRSATDLGREPRFQGAGMLDVLRALQSV